MITVLIVDDDFMVAKVHAGFIQRTSGFAVVGVAHTGAQAIAETTRLQPDLVLLDIHLPDINGLDLMARLRETAPELDVLVISAAREVETVRRALRGGIVHYLIKPFSQSDLQERLEHYRSAYQGLDMSKDVAEQSDVNRVFGLERAERTARTENRLPKGCSAETLRRVVDVLQSAEADLSAAEVADLLGTSRVSARRYLEYLHDEARVEVRLKYGAGRPERRYELNPV
ncbi:response regulator [Arthrobacter sp. SO3]|uniref:response regulator n=1 Tax=Arthrobacter sp. SO3 TaxID=1897057 RepID=UPI001CFF8B07|nr:response regulator [Arthrobacter sp. SO3]MCB5293221.1 Transcriptional regulatory protein CitT [Arthrobacter sp. SO3]